MARITAEARQRTKDLALYEQQCVAEVDKYNRENDDDLTVGDVRENAKYTLSPKILTHVSFEDYLNHKYPERVVKRRRRAAQNEARAAFNSLPLRERLKIQALRELVLLVQQHGKNLEQLEAEFELEMEDDAGMGMF